MSIEIRDRHEATALMALDRYRNETRFRAYVQSIVARVMKDHGPVDPEKADRDAHDIALTVGAMMVETMFQEDGELANLRLERDALRELLEKQVGLSLAPPMLLQPRTNRA